MNNSEMKSELHRLYSLGFGLHWLKKNSKAPINKGWTTAPRADLQVLERTYQLGYGLGVRLGSHSLLSIGTYLANIDIDVKSGLQPDLDAAKAVVLDAFPGFDLSTAPIVKTGYGYRVFIRTLTPVPSRVLGRSKDRIKVKMPNAPVNAEQKKLLSDADIKLGYRIRPAWEVEIMSEGRQVVLPPTIHPDTGKMFTWLRPFTRIEDIPLVETGGLAPDIPVAAEMGEASFQVVDVDLSRLPPDYRAMLVSGEGVTDRSAAMFSTTIVMLRMGYTDNEILTALTCRDFALGAVAYEHRQTDDRAYAADWVRKYCLMKAVSETNAAKAFEAEVVTRVLSDDEAEKQLEEVCPAKPWSERLSRAAKGGVKPSLKNAVLILENTVGSNLFMLNEFTGREHYGIDTPWGGKAGVTITDNDIILIKHWLEVKFGVEFATSTIHEVVATMTKGNSYHPVRDYLGGLVWDGTPRLAGWLKRNFGCQEPDCYLDQVFTKWLVASVTRVYEPGAKFDWMPIFQGGQGVGKSMFGALLFGLDWFCDWLPNLADKDAALGLRGKLVVEFGELDSFRKNEVETVKAFVTRQVDTVRPPYGRRTLELKRQTVFFGTTNSEWFLKDDSGNRRFMPVVVDRLNFGALERDRHQLWAEARYLYVMGLVPVLDMEGEAVAVAAELQASKMEITEVDVYTERLLAWVESSDPAKLPTDKFAIQDLFNDMSGPLKMEKMNGHTLKMAAKALKKAGAVNWKSHGLKKWRF